MADIIYTSNYNPTFTMASEYEVNGQRILEIWTAYIPFKSQADRNKYFKNTHHEHVLNVELDTVNGESKVIFFFDDSDISDIYPPQNNIPNEATLFGMLDNLVILNG